MRKTKSRRNKKSKSIRRSTNSSHSNQSKKHQKSHHMENGKIVKKFMEMLNCIKVFHWQTSSYAKHKASNKLYKDLNENIDKFVETLLGKNNDKIHHLEKRLVLYNECTTGSDNIKNRVFEFCEFLEDMNMYFDKDKDSDILSIRDDILGNLNKFLYLSRFS